MVVLVVVVGVFLWGGGSWGERSSSTTLTPSAVSSTTLPAVTASVPSDIQVFDLLRSNSDSLEFLQKYPDSAVTNKTLLHGEDIINGLSGPRFKELYQNISVEDDRYVFVELSSGSDRSLISILDLKEQKVTKAFWIILVKMG